MMVGEFKDIMIFREDPADMMPNVENPLPTSGPHLRYVYADRVEQIAPLMSFLDTPLGDVKRDVERAIDRGNFMDLLDTYDRLLVLNEFDETGEAAKLAGMSDVEHAIVGEKERLVKAGLIRSVSQKRSLFEVDETLESMDYRGNGEEYALKFYGGNTQEDMPARHKYQILSLFEHVAQTTTRSKDGIKARMNGVKKDLSRKVKSTELYALALEKSSCSGTTDVVGVAKFNITPLIKHFKALKKLGMDRFVYSVYFDYAAVTPSKRSHGIGREISRLAYKVLPGRLMTRERRIAKNSNQEYALQAPLMLTSADCTSWGSFEFVTASNLFMRFAGVSGCYRQTQGVVPSSSDYTPKYYKAAFNVP